MIKEVQMNTARYKLTFIESKLEIVFRATHFDLDFLMVNAA